MNHSKIYLDSYLEAAEKICIKADFIEKTLLKRFVKFNSVEELLQVKKRMIANHRREKGISEIEFQKYYIAEIDNKIELKQKEFNETLLKELNKESVSVKATKLSLQKKKQFQAQVVKISRLFTSISIPKSSIRLLNINRNVFTSKKFKFSKVRVKFAAGALAMGLSGLALTSCNPNDQTQQQIIEQQQQQIDQQNEQIKQINELIAALENQNKSQSGTSNSENKKISENLSFDIQDNEHLKQSIINYVKDSLPKGNHFDQANLRGQVRSLINTFYLMHIDQFDMQYVTNLYWNSTQTTKSIFDDAMVQKNFRAVDSITSSLEGNTILDLTQLDADKIGSQIEYGMRLNNATIYDALKKGDNTTISLTTKKMSEFLQSLKQGTPTTNLLYYSMALREAKVMKEHLAYINYVTSARTILADGTEESLYYGINKCSTFDDVMLLKSNNGILSYNEQIMLSLYDQLEQQFSLMPMYSANVPENNQNIDSLVDSICAELMKDTNLFNTYVANPAWSTSFASKSTIQKSSSKKAVSVGTTTGTTTTTTTTADSSSMTSEQKAQADQQANLRKYIKINGIIIYTDELQKYSRAFSEAYSLGSDNAVDDIEEGYSQKATRHKYDYFGYDVESEIDPSWDNNKSDTIWAEFVRGYNATWSSYKSKKKDANKANNKAQSEFVSVPERVVNEEVIENGTVSNPDLNQSTQNGNSNEIVEEGRLPNPELDGENENQTNQSGNSGSANNNSNNEANNNNSTIINEGTYFEPVEESEKNSSVEKIEHGKIDSDSATSSSEEVIESGRVNANSTSNNNTETSQEVETKSAEATVKEALDSAGQSDVSVTVEAHTESYSNTDKKEDTATGTTLSFNTFRDSFIKQLKEFKQMLTPQKDVINSMYCSNKTETNSYVKTLQKIEPVVQSKTI